MSITCFDWKLIFQSFFLCYYIKLFIMSILSSTKAGILGIHLSYEDYIKRGYTPGRFDNNIAYPIKIWFDNKHYLIRNDFIEQHTKNCLYYANIWGLPRFYINNFKDLELIETYWTAKLQKTRAGYKRKIEKALNAKHRKRLHFADLTWSTWHRMSAINS